MQTKLQPADQLQAQHCVPVVVADYETDGDTHELSSISDIVSFQLELKKTLPHAADTLPLDGSSNNSNTRGSIIDQDTNSDSRIACNSSSTTEHCAGCGR